METFRWAGWRDEAKKKKRWEADWTKPMLDPQYNVEKELKYYRDSKENYGDIGLSDLSFSFSVTFNNNMVKTFMRSMLLPFCNLVEEIIFALFA